MDQERVQSWLQIGGLFGVIASLYFVGVQMDQTQDIARSSEYQARAGTSISVLTAPLASETLLQALTKDATGQLITLTPEEEMAATYFLWAQLVYLENEHYQYGAGYVSDEQWATNVVDIQELFESELNTAIWEKSKDTFRQTFREEVDRIR